MILLGEDDYICLLQELPDLYFSLPRERQERIMRMIHRKLIHGMPFKRLVSRIRNLSNPVEVTR